VGEFIKLKQWSDVESYRSKFEERTRLMLIEPLMMSSTLSPVILVVSMRNWGWECWVKDQRHWRRPLKHPYTKSYLWTTKRKNPGFIPGLQQKAAPCTTSNFLPSFFLTNSAGEANGLVLGCIVELFRNSWIIFSIYYFWWCE